ncbi:MAG TPA: CoA transferase [Candidatus Dormibacteraeota bacterium]
MDLILSGPELAAATAARRLAGWTGTPAPAPDDGQAGAMLIRRLRVPGDGELHAGISWHGPASLGERPGGEAAVQAMSGLMQVHGRDLGVPRRLGLEVASVTSGVLLTHAVLAQLVARTRGRGRAQVETSVLEAAFLLASHYIAGATCRDRGDWTPPPPAAAPGPPFRSSDGRWFEIETLDPAAWQRFWRALGAGDADMSTAWTHFRSRYFRARCTLPPAFPEAAGRHHLADIVAAAAANRVSLVEVRECGEVLADTGLPAERAAVAPMGTEQPAAAASVPPAAGAALPLEGIEVVEATSRIQGPLAGLLLQMLGAHVVRVEPPGGDPIRLVPPYAGDDGYFFAAFNRGKEAVELDLGSPAGRRELADLVTGADVFLHNWGPGRADHWGLGANDMAAWSPRLTYVEASGWGDQERNRRLVGTEFLVQAHAGMGAGLTPEGEPPAPSRVLLVDCLGALVACEGALAGLWRVATTGRGQRVDASLMAGAMSLQAHVLAGLRELKERFRCHGRPVWGPLQRPLETADGYVAVDVEGDRDTAKLCRLVGATAGRGEAGERAAAARFRERGVRQWEEMLTGAGVPCGSVCSDLAQLPTDPRLAALLEELPGGCHVAATPWRWAA